MVVSLRLAPNPSVLSCCIVSSRVARLSTKSPLTSHVVSRSTGRRSRSRQFRGGLVQRFSARKRPRGRVRRRRLGGVGTAAGTCGTGRQENPQRSSVFANRQRTLRRLATRPDIQASPAVVRFNRPSASGRSFFRYSPAVFVIQKREKLIV